VSLLGGDQIGRGRAAVLIVVLALFNLGFAGTLIWVAYVAPQPGAFNNSGAAIPDFAAFWAAGRLTLEGTPPLAYDWIAHRAVEVAGLGRDFSGWMPWHYPPPFQLAVTPFAMLPLWPAMALWATLTLGFYLWVCWRILPDPLTLAAALAAAPTAIILVNGQTGFLVAGLLGLFLLSVDRRPVAAGIALGLIAIKPHLALATPFALAAGGRWRAFTAAALTVTALAAVAWAVFGSEIWGAFIGSFSDTTGVFVGTAVGKQRWEMVANFYGWSRVLGAGFGLALAVQAALALAIMVPLIRAWHGDRLTPEIKAALLCFATAAITPRILNYDLHILVIGGLFQVRHALRAGFFPGEQLLLGAALLAAFLSILFAPGVAWLLAAVLFGGCWWGHARQRAEGTPPRRPV
jgi:hypothetical protein